MPYPNKKYGKKIYEHLYYVGAKFADANLPATSNDLAPSNDVELLECAAPELDGSLLLEHHGPAPLQRAVWGATFCSYLYAYLKMLQWD